MKKKEERRVYNSNFLDSCNNAVNGIIYAATTQKNIKIQLIIAVAVMILSLFFDLTRAEFLSLTFAVFLVIFAELINTAIETVVDLFTDLYHPKAKIAKDVAAGAVVLASANAIVVAYFLFADKLGSMGQIVLQRVVNSPMHLVFVGIILTIIAIIAIKAATNKTVQGKPKKQFIPSGQAALAFAVLTSIWINTQDVIAFVLALALSLLVAGNRIENKARTFSEVLFGSCIGILIVLMVYALTIFK